MQVLFVLLLMSFWNWEFCVKVAVISKLVNTIKHGPPGLVGFTGTFFTCPVTADGNDLVVESGTNLFSSLRLMYFVHGPWYKKKLEYFQIPTYPQRQCYCVDDVSQSALWALSRYQYPGESTVLYAIRSQFLVSLPFVKNFVCEGFWGVRVLPEECLMLNSSSWPCWPPMLRCALLNKDFGFHWSIPKKKIISFI